MDSNQKDLSMEVKSGEYLFIYKGDVHEDKKAKGYVVAIDQVKINEWDIMSNPLTKLQIKEVADLLEVEIAELYMPSDKLNPGDFDDDELLKIMANDPAQMRTPIILSEGKSFIVKSPYDLVYDNLATKSIKKEHHENQKNTND